MSKRKSKKLFALSSAALAATGALFSQAEKAGAATVTWNVAGGNAWLTNTNWTPTNVPTSADIATFGATQVSGNSTQINFGGAVNNGFANQIVGEIAWTGNSAPVTIGNSSTGADGLLTIAGVANVGITMGSAQNVTIQNATGSGTKKMFLTFGAPSLTVSNTSGSTSSLNISASIIGINGFIANSAASNRNVTISAANFYRGPTVLSGGTLFGTVSNTIPIFSQLSFSGTAEMSFSAGTNQAFGALVSTTSGTLTIGDTSVNTTTVSIGNDNANASYGGSIGTNSRGTLIKVGRGEQILAGDLSGLSGTASTVKIAGGTLTLNGSQSSNSFGTAVTNIFLSGGGTLNQISAVGARFTSSSALTFDGGEVIYNVPGNANTETFGTTSFRSGTNILSLTKSGGSVKVDASTQTFTRANNGQLLVRSSLLGTSGSDGFFNSTNSYTVGNSSTGAGAGRGVIPWMVTDTTIYGTGSQFAYNNGTNGFAPLLSTDYNLNTFTASQNTRLGSGTALGANTAINSLLIQPGGSVLDSVNDLTISSGGVLFANSGMIGQTPNTFSLKGPTASGGELVFYTAASATAYINARIAEGTQSKATFGGFGTTFLNGTNNYSGATTVNSGTVVVSSLADAGTASAFGTGSTTSAINLGDGTIQYTGVGASTNRVINLVGKGTIAATGGPLSITGNVTSTGGSTLPMITLGGVSSGIVTSVIGGANPLDVTKSGDSVWALTGVNSYSGATAVNSGRLLLNSTGTIKTTSRIDIAKTGTLTVDNLATNTANRLYDGTNARNVTLTGGTMQVVGATDAASTENAGVLTIGSGFSTVTNSVATSIATPLTSTMQFTAFNRTERSAALVNGTSLGLATAGAQIKVGSSGSSTSGTLVQVGTSQSGAGTYGGSTKTLAIIPYLVGDLSGTAGTSYVGMIYDTSSGLRPLGANEYTNDALTTGNNTRITTNNITQTATTINSLVFANNGTFNSGTATTTITSGQIIAGGNSGILTNGGSLAFGTAEGIIINPNAATSVTFSGQLTGTNGLTIAGNGTVALNAANANLSGGITVSSGTLAITNTNQIGASNTITLNGGTLLTSASFSATGKTFALGSGGGTINVSSGSVTMQPNSGGTQPMMVNALGQAGSLTKAGAGTLVVNDNSTTFATYTGLTTVNGGTLSIGTSNSATNTLGTSSGFVVNAGATFADDITFTNNRLFDGTNRRPVNINGGTLSLFGNSGSGITETVGVVTFGAGHGQLTANRTDSNGQPTTLSTSTIIRTENATATLNGNRLGINSGPRGQITTLDAGNSLALIGTTTLSTGATSSNKDLKIVPWMLGDSSSTSGSYAGVTYDSTSGFRALDTNEYSVAGNTSMSTSTFNYTIAATAGPGVRMNNSGGTSTTINSLLIRNGTSGTLGGPNANTTLTITSGQMIFASDVGSLFQVPDTNQISSISFGSAEGVILAAPGKGVRFGNDGPNQQYIKLVGSRGLTIGGGGTVEFSQPTSAINVDNGGRAPLTVNGTTVILTNENAFTATTPVVLNANANLNLNNKGNSFSSLTVNGSTLTSGGSSGGVTLTGSLAMTTSGAVGATISSAPTLNMNPAASTTTFISGSATQTGAFGAMTINGADNTTSKVQLLRDLSTAAVNINGGKFEVTKFNTLTNSATATVNTGATLMGNGTVAGATTVASGGRLAPGASVGQLSFGSGLTFNASSNYDWEHTAGNVIGFEGNSFDQAIVTGGNVTVTSGAKLNLSMATTDFSNAYWDSARTWSGIINDVGSGTLTGTFLTADISVTGSLTTPTGQGTFTTVASGNDLNLVWSPQTGNNSKLWVGGTAPTTSLQQTTVTNAFGRAMQSATASTTVALSFSGTDSATTNATVVASGAGSTSTTSPQLISTLGGSGINAGLNTGTTGIRTGNIVIDNQAADSAAVSQGSDNGNANISVTGTVVANRDLNGGATANLGRVLVGGTTGSQASSIITGSNAAVDDDDHATRVNIANGSVTSGGVTVSYSGGATSFTGVSQSAVVGVTGTFGTVGAKAGNVNANTLLSNGETSILGTPTVDGTVNISYTATAVATRSVTAPSVTSLGRMLTGAAISTTATTGNTYGTGGTGAFSDTETSTVQSVSGSIAGVSLLGGPTTLSTNVGATRTFSGNISGTGNVGGNFVATVNPEFSSATNVGVSFTANAVATRTVTAPSVTALGRMLTGSAISTTATTGHTYGSGGTGAHLDTEDSTVQSVSGSISGISLLGGPTTLATNTDVTRTFSGNISGTGNVGGNFSATVNPEFSSATTVGLSFTANAVATRSVTAPGVTNLSRFLSGSVINTVVSTGNTYGSGGTGAHLDTEDSTVGSYSGSLINGLTLLGGPTTLATNTGASRTISGTLSGSGSIGGTFTLAVTPEFSSSTTVGVSFVGNALATRTVTAPSVTNLGRLLTGSAVSTTATTGNTYGAGGTGAHADTEDSTVQSYSGSIGGISLLGGPTTLASNVGATRTFSGNISGTGNVGGNFSVTVNPEISAATSVGLSYTGNAVATRTVTAPSVTNLGRVLSGSSVNTVVSTGNSYGSGGTGAHLDTEDSTIQSVSGSISGVSLLGGPTTLSTNTGASRTLSGTISGSGSVGGLFTATVNPEFSSATSVGVSFTGTALALRSYSIPTATINASTNLAGTTLTGAAIVSSSDVHATSTDESVTISSAGPSSGVTLTGAGPTAFNNVSGSVSVAGSISRTIDYTSVSGAFTNAVSSTGTETNYTGTRNFDMNYSVSAGGLAIANRTANSRSSFGGALTAAVAGGGSYAGLKSKVLNDNGTNGGAEGDGDSTLNTEAVILAGNNVSGSNTVSMAWRTRNRNDGTGQSEIYPGNTPPFGGYITAQGLASDIVNLTGMENGAAVENGRRSETDTFVFQMSYEQNQVGAEEENAIAGKLFMVWLDTDPDTNDGAGLAGIAGGSDDRWRLATDGNFAVGGNMVANVQGDWTTFATANSIDTQAELDSYLGTWGVDTSTNVVWAVLDHNSQYAVVPEPGSLGVIGIGAMGLMSRRSRRKDKKRNA